MSEARRQEAVPLIAAHIADFARLLRDAGLGTGLSSVHDAVGAAALTGIDRREDFYWALRSTLIKRQEHAALFDQAFALLWQRREEALGDDGGDAGLGLQRAAISRRLHEAVAAARTTPPRTREIESREAIFRYAPVESLQRKDFAQMSAAEIDEAVRAVQSLKLPEDARKTRRLRLSHRGRRIDWRRSLALSVRTGGALVRLARRAPQTQPTPLVLLIDVSGSMEAYARLLLVLAHTLAAQRPHVSVFLFGTRLANVTRWLRHRDADEAFSRIGSLVTDWSGGTRIGESLSRFNRLWMRRMLARGGTVLLVTDGLDRIGGEFLSQETARLQRSCDRLIWLNPLLRFEGFEPKAAGVRAILPFVDLFRPVHNLASIAQLVKALSAKE